MNAASLTWDLARTGGFVAYGLLTVSVALGIALSLGWKNRTWTRFVTNEIHRFVTLLAIVFTAVHTLAVAVDPFIKLTPPEVLVPLLGSYRPAWVAAGIVSAYLLIAVHLSERLRGRIGYAWWRRLHGLAFVAFVLAIVHGIATGSDTRSLFGTAIYGSSMMLVGFLLLLRIFPPPPKVSRPWAALLTSVVASAIVVFAVVGPLAPGWSVRAGGVVPSALAAARGSAGQADAAPRGNEAPGVGTALLPQANAAPGQGTGAAGANGEADGAGGPGGLPLDTPLPFTARLSQIEGQGGDDDEGSEEGEGGEGDGEGRGRGGILLQGRLEDGTAVLQVQVVPTSGGSAGGQVLVRTGDGSTCRGALTGLSDNGLTATCSDGSGGDWGLSLDFTSGGRRSLAGTMTLTAAGGAGGPQG